MVPIKIDALSVTVLAHPMPIIANNVVNSKKIGMGVLKLLTWGLLELISFIKGKSMDSLRK